MINQARIYVPKERRKSQHSWGHPHSTTTSSSRTPLLQTLRRKALTSKEKRSRRPCCFLLLPPFPPSSFRLVLQSPTGISPGAPNRLRRARGPVVVARPFEALRLIVLSRQQFFSPLLLDVSLTAARLLRLVRANQRTFYSNFKTTTTTMLRVCLTLLSRKQTARSITPHLRLIVSVGFCPRVPFIRLGRFWCKEVNEPANKSLQ